MQATIEKVSTLERRLNVSLPAQEIDSEIQNRLKRIARDVRMHGFRPGKVPFRLEQQQYGGQWRPEGSGADHKTVLGEGRLLKDFEQQVVGLRAGESRAFELTFPEDYHGKELAGKTAQFEVTLKQVEEAVLPEVNAEFARQLGIQDGD